MKALHLYILVLCAGLIGSCAKKKYPDSVIENPVIYKFTAIIDNQPVDIEAGINNYYMYTSAEKDSNNVYNLTGNLKEANCTGVCPKSLKVEINGFDATLTKTSMLIDSAYVPKIYPVLSNAQGYRVQLRSGFNKTAASYAWDFGDGKQSTLANPVHFYSTTGSYLVKLTIKSDGGCENSISQYQKINVQPNNFSASINAITFTSGNALQFNSAINGGRQPYQYLWSFGDGGTSTSQNPVHSYSYVGSYPVTVKITDANNESITAVYNAVTDRDHSSCATNFTMQPVSKTTDSTSFVTFPKIKVTWTDASGTVYTTDNKLQSPGGRFTIDSVEDGGLNEKNEPIKKIHITFDCTVYNGTKALVIKNAVATLSIAHK